MSKNSKNKQKKNNGKNLTAYFFVIVGSIVGLFIVICAVAVFGYLKTAPSKVEKPNPGSVVSLPDTEKETTPPDNSFLNEWFLPPKKTTFLILGVDKSLLADVNIVGCFDRDTNRIDLFSMPRDTHVKLNSEDLKALRDAGRKPPSNGEMKLNEIHSYAGKELGAAYSQMAIERLLDVKIDYYVEVSLEAFRQIVDTVGGIEMDLPAGGFKYTDPYQDLYINVPGGHQRLTGEMAEGVVRFRSTYPRGDLQRIEVQQEFLRQFFKQVINKKTIMDNALSFTTTIFKYVKTNFPLTDLPKYVRYLDSLDSENFSIQTIPGSADNSRYFEINKAEAVSIVNETFNYTAEPAPSASPSASTKPAATPGIDIKSLKIQVLNGGKIVGIATSKSDILKADGFNITDIGNYTGTQKSYTRIMVKRNGIGEELKKYFDEAVIEVDTGIPASVDIIIIIGSDEKI